MRFLFTRLSRLANLYLLRLFLSLIPIFITSRSYK
ncbi:hypothetical protein PEC106664_36610 [Pectobacterium carotovorum subsp. carotovorum]|nr:hypothetical protein PEC106664_36610 [Pectobacterium carotovorum subsp. carotovorum]